MLLQKFQKSQDTLFNYGKYLGCSVLISSAYEKIVKELEEMLSLPKNQTHKQNSTNKNKTSIKHKLAVELI